MTTGHGFASTPTMYLRKETAPRAERNAEAECAKKETPAKKFQVLFRFKVCRITAAKVSAQ